MKAIILTITAVCLLGLALPTTWLQAQTVNNLANIHLVFTQFCSQRQTAIAAMSSSSPGIAYLPSSPQPTADLPKSASAPVTGRVSPPNRTPKYDAYFTLGYSHLPFYNARMDGWAARQGLSLAQPRNFVVLDLQSLTSRVEGGFRLALGIGSGANWNASVFYMGTNLGYALLLHNAHRISVGMGLGFANHSFSFSANNRPPNFSHVSVPGSRRPELSWTDLSVNPYIRYTYCQYQQPGLHLHNHTPVHIPLVFTLEVGYMANTTSTDADYGYTVSNGKSSHFVKLAAASDPEGNVDAAFYGMVGVGFHFR